MSSITNHCPSATVEISPLAEDRKEEKAISLEERVAKLEKKFKKVKSQAKEEDGYDSDDEEVGKKSPSRCRLATLMTATLSATVAIAAYSNNVVLTSIAAGITGSTAKSIMRTISVAKRVAILAAATGAAFAADYLLQQHTSAPNLQLGTIALAVDIGVLNREIKKWILGKKEKSVDNSKTKDQDTNLLIKPASNEASSETV